MKYSNFLSLCVLIVAQNFLSGSAFAWEDEIIAKGKVQGMAALFAPGAKSTDFNRVKIFSKINVTENKNGPLGETSTISDIILGKAKNKYPEADQGGLYMVAKDNNLFAYFVGADWCNHGESKISGLVKAVRIGTLDERNVVHLVDGITFGNYAQDHEFLYNKRNFLARMIMLNTSTRDSYGSYTAIDGLVIDVSKSESCDYDDTQYTIQGKTPEMILLPKEITERN